MRGSCRVAVHRKLVIDWGALTRGLKAERAGVSGGAKACGALSMPRTALKNKHNKGVGAGAAVLGDKHTGGEGWGVHQAGWVPSKGWIRVPSRQREC